MRKLISNPTTRYSVNGKPYIRFRLKGRRPRLNIGEVVEIQSELEHKCGHYVLERAPIDKAGARCSYCDICVSCEDIMGRFKGSGLDNTCLISVSMPGKLIASICSVGWTPNHDAREYGVFKKLDNIMEDL